MKLAWRADGIAKEQHSMKGGFKKKTREVSNAGEVQSKACLEKREKEVNGKLGFSE